MKSPLGTLLNKVPVPYVSQGSNFSLPWIDRPDSTVHMAAMSAVGTLYSIITRLGESTAMVEWDLFRPSPTGHPDDRPRVKAHAALDLLISPNPWMSWFEFTEVYMQHLDLTGEAWWVVSRSKRSKIPLELWPVRPDRIEPVPDRNNFISGYLYAGPQGEEIPLGVKDVIYFRRPNPLDPYRGLGPVGAIMPDLDTNRLSAEWSRNFFRNSAEPGGIIEVDRSLDDDEFEMLRQRWAQQHRGTAAAHRVALIEAGMKWVDRKYSQRDMQFVEGRKDARDVIREAYGVPKFVLGDVDDVNRASARESSVFFNQYLIVPRLKRIKQVLNHRLLPLFGKEAASLEFDFRNPVPPDRHSDNEEMLAQTQGASMLVTAGYDPGGVTKALGLPDIAFVGRPEPAGSDSSGAVSRGLPTPDGESRPDREPSTSNRLTSLDWWMRVDTMVDAWSDVMVEQQAQMLGRITSIIDRRRPEELSSLAGYVSVDRACQMLAMALRAQARAGAQRVAASASLHGAAIAPAVVEGGLADDLQAMASITANMLLNRQCADVAQVAMRCWTPGTTSSDIVPLVSGLLPSAESVRADLASALWAAENEGRFATMEQAEQAGIHPAWYEPVALDMHTECPSCANMTGRRLSSLAEARAAYPFGSLRDCTQRPPCRGSVDPQWTAGEQTTEAQSTRPT